MGIVVVSGLVLAPTAQAAPDDPVIGWVTGPVTRAFTGGTVAGGTYQVPEDLSGADVTNESTLGNALAQAVSWAAGGGELSTVVGVSVPTALRGDLWFDPEAGGPRDDFGRVLAPVTRSELDAVLPSPEDLWSVTLTGAQLSKMLEQQWQGDDAEPATPDLPTLHLGLSDNVRYSYDPTRARGDRVTSAIINGAPLAQTATYRVAAPRSLVQGGHGITALTQGTDAGPSQGHTDRSALLWALGSHVVPDLTERAIGVLAVPELVAPGTTLDVRLTGLSLTSHDAPVRPAVEVRLADVELSPWYWVGDVLPADVVTLHLDVPDGVATGPTSLMLAVWATGQPSTVYLPTTVTAGRQVTATTLVVPVREQVHGDLDPRVRLDVTVSPATAPGPVEILVDGVVVASLPLQDGRASWQLDPSAHAGSYDVAVRYPGDGAFTTSVSETVRVTVRPVASGTTLTVRRPAASWLPWLWASQVWLDTGAPPAGTVEVRQGQRVLARSRVAAGLAGGVLPAPGTGTHRLTAVFVPDAPRDVLTSSSPAVTVRR